MKKLVTSIVAIILISFSLLAGCARQVVLGDIASREFHFTDFSRISVGHTGGLLNLWNAGKSHFEIEVVPSSSYQVSVTANDNIFDWINISQSEDTLKITIDRSKIRTAKAVIKAQISMPELRSIDLSGESIGVVKGFNSGQDFNAQVSEASNLDLDIKSGKTALEISSSSRAAVRGKFSNFDATVSGASTLETDIQADNASYDVSSSSHVTHAGSSQEFKAIISGASTLDVDAETGITSLELSSSSRFIGDINASDIEMLLSGASGVHLKGSGGNATVRGSSSSELNMTDFTLKNTEVYLSGASNADINVNGRLNADLTSASTLKYAGSPSLGDVSVTGASQMTRK